MGRYRLLCLACKVPLMLQQAALIFFPQDCRWDFCYCQHTPWIHRDTVCSDPQHCCRQRWHEQRPESSCS
uniref:Uncharacterized protein n=1 Tax=Junco hyemalis TaxID=40217 RepID=A0A8C5JPA6_JUNHY